MSREKKQIELPVAQPGELQARLIRLREEAGYSVSQMADALCLSKEVVQRLEDENFDGLAEPPYIRGYLRNYSKLSGEDPVELIAVYESLRGADASELDFHLGSSSGVDIANKKSISPVVVQLLLFAVLLSAIIGLTMLPAVNKWIKDSWTSLSSQFSAPSQKYDNPDLIGELPVLLPLSEGEAVTSESLGSTVAGSLDSVDKTPQNSGENSEIGGDKATETVAEETTTEEVNKEDKQETAANPTGKIALKLVFNKDVWLRIRNKNNKTVYEGLNKSGTNKSLQFERPITFRVGNAQGLSLFVDDAAVDISKYIDGSIANFTLE